MNPSSKVIGFLWILLISGIQVQFTNSNLDFDYYSDSNEYTALAEFM